MPDGEGLDFTVRRSAAVPPPLIAVYVRCPGESAVLVLGPGAQTAEQPHPHGGKRA